MSKEYFELLNKSLSPLMSVVDKLEKVTKYGGNPPARLSSYLSSATTSNILILSETARKKLPQ